MPEVPSLNKLVMAISSSVLEAQEKIEAAQLGNLMSYFRRKPGRKGFFPVTMKVNLPSLRPEAPPGATDAYQVPYLSVLPYSSLRIKQVDVDFDVAFNALNPAETKDFAAPDDQAGGEGPELERAEQLPNLSIDLGGLKKGGGFTAHVHLSLEGVELPEGAARLINELMKTNQVYESPKPPETGPEEDGETTGRGRSRPGPRRQPDYYYK